MTQLSVSTAALRKGSFIAALSAAFFGSSVIFIRFAYQAGVLPGTAIFLRFSIASIVLLLFLSFGRRWVPLSSSQLVAFFLMGLLGFSIMGTTAFVAVSLIPAWLVSLFTAFYPVTINLGSWLLMGERPSPGQVVALSAVFTGAVLLFWQPFEDAALAGILLMVLNVTTVTLYILLGQRWTRSVPPPVSTVWTVIGAALGTLVYALVVDEFSFTFAPVGWLWAVCFGVISTVFSISLLWWSINLIGPSRASIIGSFEPLVGVVLAVLLLGERLSSLQLSGGVLILCGMALVQWPSEPGRL